MAKYKSKIVKIGEVAVDSGKLMIIDPAYLGKGGLEFDHSLFAPKIDWNKLCQGLGTIQLTSRSKEIKSQLKDKDIGTWGGDGLAMICPTGFGDGVYYVYAKVTDYGDDGGERVDEIKIDTKNAYW